MNEFIENLQSQGIYSFTKSELKKYLNASNDAVVKHLQRYSLKQKVLRIKKDFYIILPVEYKNAGILPPFWFIDDLMKYLEREYYVGLMSAASAHGASHQQPQVFQVIVNKNIRNIEIKGLRIQFFVKKEINSSNLESKKSETGYVKISDPDLTALDLLKYEKKIGGLDSATTIISELVSKIKVDRIIDIAQKENGEIYLRRLGFILENIINEKDKSNDINNNLMKREYIGLLDPALPKKGAKYNKKWGLYINRDIEPDEI